MARRYIALSILAALVLSLFCLAAPNTQATGADSALSTLLKAYPLESLSYEYKNSGETESAFVYYSPAPLLLNACEMKDTPQMGELAKASVALSMAAYDRNHVNSLLKGMGFEPYDNTYVYDRSKNGLTFDDCDYVAYTIAWRDILNPVDNETYRIYCVPIQGTPPNAEWLSDFHLGTGNEHEGFRKASLEVYNQLQTYFADDEMDADKRIVWLTGHSRGAACANLIAGWLSRNSEDTKAEHVFGYTFACPAVSLKADTTLTNIINFNNIGDMVTMLPMDEWGYKRNGKDITLNTSELQLDNVRQQFERTTGKTYAAEVTDANYKTLLTEIIGTDRDVFYDSAILQTTLALAGWFLGGKDPGILFDILNTYLRTTNQVELVAEVIGIHHKNFYKALVETGDENDSLCIWAYKAYNETLEMTQSEFSSYRNANSENVAKLEKRSGVKIVDAQSFLTANNELKKVNSSARSAAECLFAAQSLIADEDGNVMDKIQHGHTQATYTVWINSMYYGYMGWFDNDKVQDAYVDQVCLSVGNWAFEYCDNLTKLSLPSTIGHYAVAYCPGLRIVTLPVDYDITEKPFYGTSGVTTIHYTYGQTGVMMDRSSYSSSSNHYGDTLEYCSRGALESIDFAEGITHIGSYLFYDGTYSAASVKSISLPSTLESIGDYAFYYCSNADSTISFPKSLRVIGNCAFYECSNLVITDSLPDGLTTIGNHAFYGCDGLTKLTIPKSVTYVGSSAFEECDGLEELTIPDTLTNLGTNAFSYCSGLRTVTLPVDYNVNSKPFYGTRGVTTIHYTYGQTGVMMDRSSYSSSSNHYGDTLEYCSRDALESIDFAEGITHIGNYLFYTSNGSAASLKSITLPSTLESIGYSAFYYCSNLERVSYCGTQGQWIMIALGDNNSSLTNAPIQFHDYENGVCTDCGHGAFVFGDTDSNKEVDCNDAIYLLLHVLFGEENYSLNGAQGDIDGNGTVSHDDATYLLLHALFGEMFYPLSKG